MVSGGSNNLRIHKMDDQQLLSCDDEQQRRADILAHPTLNGIDYIEVDPNDHTILRVFFLKPLPPKNAANPNDTNDAYGITADLTKIQITGGTRIVGIFAVAAQREPAGSLTIHVNAGGDYSVYALTLAVDPTKLDPFLGRVLLSFMAACPVDFDCRPVVECPPPALDERLIDYEAKDYESFRRLLLDLLPQLNPRFTERNPSDLGIALIELLAHTGDHLSYYQDAAANEAFLETLRQRISAQRHSKLIDYRMHDGHNAWAYIHFNVGATASLKMGTKILTRITAPLRGMSAPPDVLIDDAKITADALDTDPALASTIVFETTFNANFDPTNNEILVHAWGDEECCLAPGTTEVFLYSVVGGNPAVRPALKKGDYLLLEEVKGPLTGAAADADPAYRQVVLIDDVANTEDPVYSDTLVNGALIRWTMGTNPLPLLRVRWTRADALTFPLCLSARHPDTGLIRNISVARGNIALADHGLTTSETLPAPRPTVLGLPLRIVLTRAPLTMQCEPESLQYDPTNARPKTERRALSCNARDAKPAVALLITFPTDVELWTPVPDLLDSPPFAENFVAEVDNNGVAILRFGDGEYGRIPVDAISIQAAYRIGNGRAGNVGAEAFAHVALTGPANWLKAVRNPLAARGGTDPETIEEVRQLAPAAMRAEQFRAVTEADYAQATQKLPEVAGAVASFRWTGSWYTVFVGIDPRDSNDLLNLPNGRTRLSDTLARRVRAFLTRYRLAGYDLEIRPPIFVPLEIEMDVCAAPGYFRTEVGKAVTDALSNRVLPNGTRGFFHPDHFTFGQPVYLSQLYAAVEKVEGVDSVVIKTFQHFGQAANGELAKGVMPMDAWEIAQCENDPNFMEHGVLHVNALGGKA